MTLSKAALIGSGRPTWIRYALGRGRLMRGGDLFLAVSDALREQAIALGYPAERTLTHYNGVDLDRFHPGDGRREPGLVLHVGRLVEKKGTAALIEAMAGMPDARLVVIGDGPLRRALELRARTVRCNSSARSPPTRSPHGCGVRRCSPRRASPPATAMRKGCPTWWSRRPPRGCRWSATLHSGIPEAVADGETGFLVPEGDAAALAARLGALLGSEALRRRDGRGGAVAGGGAVRPRSADRAARGIIR